MRRRTGPHEDETHPSILTTAMTAHHASTCIDAEPDPHTHQYVERNA